jgi:HlyD family secretion protein
MKRIIFWTIVIGIIAGGGAAGYRHFRAAAATADSVYKTAAIKRGDITFVTKSSGTVQPVLSVQVGAVVSGPICQVCVDFNDKVKKDQLLAKIDPLLFKASRDQAAASLACAKANLMQAEAKLEQTRREWSRAQGLLPQKAIADTDYDLSRSNYQTAVATVALCKAQIQQNAGALDLAETNLKYTEIRSPVDGIVTDRKVDPGQSLAATYQTPVMFVVAPDLEKRVYILASVDEADIGLIRDAQAKKQPVTFTVEAYPKDKFQGKIREVRLTSTTVQNIVTYTVVVEAPNLQLKLLPGMTPTLNFQIETRKKVLKVPNSALRFYPKPEQVRESDRSILDGKTDEEEEKKGGSSKTSAKADDDSPESDRKERHVWITDGDLLSAVKITIGLEDEKFTEVVSGDLKEGQLVVTGLKTK